MQTFAGEGREFKLVGQAQRVVDQELKTEMIKFKSCVIIELRKSSDIRWLLCSDCQNVHLDHRQTVGNRAEENVFISLYRNVTFLTHNTN